MDVVQAVGLLLLAAGGGVLAWGGHRLSDARRRLEAARADILRLQDGLRSALDDRDSTVRRVRDQSDAQRRFAHEPVARDLLEVIDNLERALDAWPEGADTEHVAGVRMILGQLLAVLQRHGVQRLDAVGRPFDPAEHEAVATEPSAEHPEHTVLSEWSGGYRLHDRLLRPARVVLAVPPEAPSEEPAESPPGDSAEALPGESAEAPPEE